MKIIVSWITAETVIKCKKDPAVMDRIQLVNPMSYEGIVLFDMLINLPDDYTISGKIDGINEYVVITLSKLGSIEINTKDFRDITISG